MLGWGAGHRLTPSPPPLFTVYIFRSKAGVVLGVSLRVGGKSIRANSCSHLKSILEGVSF